MKAAHFLTITCCLMLTSLSPLSANSQTWRPQGRFGKRISPSQLSLEDQAVFPVMDFSTIPEIPVEEIFSETELTQFKLKPRLCSVSGLHGFPVCEFVTSSSDRDTEEIGNFFDL